MAMAATKVKVGSVDALNRLTGCPRCGSGDLTPAGSPAGVFDALAWSSLTIPIGTNNAMPPMRKCKACGWVAEVGR